MKQLVLTAKRNPGAWEHTVSRLPQDRKAAAAFAATVQRLVDAGSPSSSTPPAARARLGLDNLVDGEGNVLDAESHATCPGHAAAVSEYRPDDVTYYCVDPTANGHQGRWAGAVTTPTVVGGKMTEEAKAARREVIEDLSVRHPRRVWLRRNVSAARMSHHSRHLPDAFAEARSV